MEYALSVADAIVAGGQVDTIYTDFAKASYGILLTKLKNRLDTIFEVEWVESSIPAAISIVQCRKIKI